MCELSSSKFKTLIKATLRAIYLTYLLNSSLGLSSNKNPEMGNVHLVTAQVVHLTGMAPRSVSEKRDKSWTVPNTVTSLEVCTWAFPTVLRLTFKSGLATLVNYSFLNCSKKRSRIERVQHRWTQLRLLTSPRSLAWTTLAPQHLSARLYYYRGWPHPEIKFSGVGIRVAIRRCRLVIGLSSVFA
jgi:hypothetical protein